MRANILVYGFLYTKVSYPSILSIEAGVDFIPLV